MTCTRLFVDFGRSIKPFNLSPNQNAPNRFLEERVSSETGAPLAGQKKHTAGLARMTAERSRKVRGVA